MVETSKTKLKIDDKGVIEKGEEPTLISEENQILTQQSQTGGDKSGSDDLFQHKVAAILEWI